MISINAKILISSMNRLLLPAAALLVSVQSAVLLAQDTAGGQPMAPVQPLAPPSDNAPALTTPGATSSPSSTEVPPPAPKTSVASAPSSPNEVARIQQQEIIRRQELMFRANQALASAQKAELGASYPEARQNYLFAAEAYGSISRSTDSYAKSAEGLTRVDLHLYDDALKMGDTARAKQLIDEVVKYNPNNKVANEKRAQLMHAMENPNDTSLLGNPAVTPALVNKVNRIQDLFIQAEQFRRTGQWDLAEARLKTILGIDPYNIAATKALEKIVAQKYAYAETARDETREERLRQVEEKWYEPINNKDEVTSAEEAQPTLNRANNFGIDQMLKAINVSLNFDNASIESATSFLSGESKRLDPSHKGINFIIQPAASSSAKPISLTLNNVPLEVALRYVCQLANVKYKVQDYAISIIPFSEDPNDLISRTFNVPPNFVAPPSSSAVTSVTTAFNGGGGGGARPVPTAGGADTADTDAGDPVRKALEAKGVKFPPGASAVYTATTGQLTIVNTADQMELIEELVNAGQAPTLMVRIASKFVEINQQDLNDLTINTAFNYLNPFTQSTQSSISTPQFNTALPGSAGFAPNGIQQLISPASGAVNALYMRAFINNSQYNVVITALAQKESFDMLSDPFVLTKSGEQGVLEAVRVFPYPIAFDPPQLVTQTNNQATTTLVAIASPPVVIATTPTDFKKRNVGVRLVVKPQVTADNKTVDLSLFPEVTDFEGFINYGSPIYIGNVDGTSSLLSTNEINQPVFNTRRINTKVLIHDGSTVILGGLIRDDVQNINDKVPFLGDLPLVGRLFQSKAVKDTKRDLIMFVTANIYRNDGELLNPPEEINASDILTSSAGFSSVGTH